TGAPVIGDRQAFPVWHERVVWSAQHGADIVSVVIGGIKISVIADVRRELHRHFVLFMECACAQFCVVAQVCSICRQEMLQNLPRFLPSRSTEGHEGIERFARKQTCSCRRPRRQVISNSAAGGSVSYNVAEMT